MSPRAWVELLDPTRFGLSAGVEPADLDQLETELGAVLPIDVREFYRTSDGIYDPDAQTHWIWPTGHLLEGNRRARELGLDPGLIAFGDNGCGEPFCVTVGDETTVYCFYPIELEARPIAPDLRSFWTGLSTSTLKT